MPRCDGGATTGVVATFATIQTVAVRRRHPLPQRLLPQRLRPFPTWATMDVQADPFPSETAKETAIPTLTVQAVFIVSNATDESPYLDAMKAAPTRVATTPMAAVEVRRRRLRLQVLHLLLLQLRDASISSSTGKKDTFGKKNGSNASGACSAEVDAVSARN